MRLFFLNCNKHEHRRKIWHKSTKMLPWVNMNSDGIFIRQRIDAFLHNLRDSKNHIRNRVGPVEKLCCRHKSLKTLHNCLPGNSRHASGIITAHITFHGCVRRVTGATSLRGSPTVRPSLCRQFMKVLKLRARIAWRHGQISRYPFYITQQLYLQLCASMRRRQALVLGRPIWFYCKEAFSYTVVSLRMEKSIQYHNC